MTPLARRGGYHLFWLAGGTALALSLAMAGTPQAAFAQSVSSTGDVSPTQSPNPAANWNVGGALYVGHTGTGELTIGTGGAVTNTIGYIATNVGSSGTVTVAGEGSTWKNASSLYVGNIGNGTLTIEDGGTVSNTIGFVGMNSGSSGNVTVRGEGSTWDNASDLYVGYIGNGTLTIEDGGMVSSLATTLGNVSGTGTLNLTGTEGARGVLETGYVSKGAGGASVTFDGGILRATDDDADFLLNFNDGDVTIADGGAFLDTKDFQKGVGTELSGSGGLTKLGGGTLTLSSVNTYAGGTVVKQGLLQAYVPNALGTGPVNVNQEAYLFFRDSASAGPLKITNQGYIGFYEGTSAGAASITNTRPSDTHGYLYFYDTASAGNAIITNNNGGETRFYGSSTADDAIIVNNASGRVEISYLTADSIAIGSLSGGGTVNLGSKALMLGGLGKNDTIGGVIVGSGGSLTKIGIGTLTLSGDNTYTGTTHIASGTLQIGNGGTSGSVAGNIANDGALIFDRSNALTYGGAISGAGQLIKQGAGALTLTNTSTYTGDTVISDGTLAVNGSIAGSSTQVENGGMLGGSGTTGEVTIADGGTIAPGASIGTLTVDGDLSLSAGSFLDYELGGPGSEGNPGSGDRIAVTGDLALDGTVNLTQSGNSADGTAGFGYYRLMTYGGTLTDRGLEIGATPPLSEPGDFEIQTGGGNVDLFIAVVGDDRLQHWQGGDGTWNASNPQWLNQGGDAPVTWAGNHAVFKDQPGGFDGGAISIEGTQSFKGIQFVDEGYKLTGDGALQTAADGSEIRVLAASAKIATKIGGAGGLTKNGAGTLILSGANTYTGGTMIAGGTLQIATDANLGDASGGLTFNGGTLRNTAVFETARNVTLNRNGGAFWTDTDLTINGAVSGSGDLTKTSFGRLTLSAINTYAGGTVINQGEILAMTTGALGTGPVNVNQAWLSFADGASAGALELTNEWGYIEFYDGTSAGEAAIWNNSGVVSFNINSTAGAATIANNNYGTVGFNDSASAGTATITNNNAGEIHFHGSSTADDATIVNNAGGHVEIANLTTEGIAIGSLSGDGRVTLGSKALTLSALGKNDTIGGVISGSGGSLAKIGAGTLTLTGDNTYTGGTDVASGTLRIGNGGISGSVAGNITNDATLVFNRRNALTYSGSISGTGQLMKQGAGVLTLSGDNTYTGGTDVESGTLRIGNGGTAGLVAGNIANDGALIFDRSNALIYGGAISGTGQVTKQGAGALLLMGESTYTGDTIVSDGLLLVHGSIASSFALVENGAKLGGSGILGDVMVADGGTMAPGRSLGVLTVDGDLSLSAGSSLDYELGGPGSRGNPGSGNSNRIAVTGDLALDGTLNILQRSHADDVSFGYYRLMTYEGALTDSGLEIGDTPPPSVPAAYEIQAGDGNVDLFIAVVGDDQLQHWRGGDGIWDATNPQWRNLGGDAHVTWAGNHAVFMKGPGHLDGGTITVEGTQSFKGLQFVHDGYVLTGEGSLQTDADGSEIRVLADSAEIATEITGAGGLTKTEAGTLILSGNNSYQGGTTIANGTLQVAVNANLGAASGSLAFNGGTLRNTAGFATARAITLHEGGGAFRTDADLTVNGRVSGSGSLTKIGASTLTLSGTNTYTGGTVVNAGTIRATTTGALGTGPVNVNQAALSFADSAGAGILVITNDQSSINFYDETSAGEATITNDDGGTSFNNNSTAGNATIANNNSGTLDFYDTASAGTAIITNNDDGRTDFHGSNTADDATIVNNAGGHVEIANLTADGIAIGSLSGDGQVRLGSKALTLGGLGKNDTIGGVIAGSGGSLVKIGAGTLTLSGANTYSGGNALVGGIVVVSSDANLGAASGALSFDGGTLENSAAFTTSRDIALNGAGRLITDADLDVDGTISGPGALFKRGAGMLTLNGVNSYTGITTIQAGKLVIGDDGHSDARIAGDVIVGNNATLGGIGTIGGDVDINGTLSPGNSPGTLDIVGDLSLGSTSTSLFELNAQGNVGSSEDDLVGVGGDLSLGGRLDALVAGAGYYRLFDYGGSLTDSSFDSQSVTSTTTSFTVDGAEVETGIEHQVNLAVLGPDQVMQFWDGADETGNGTVDGGAGTWSAADTNWTGRPGRAGVNGPWESSVGVFAGAAGGMVMVDGTQAFDTLQFATDGYTLIAGELAISPASGSSGTINVDGGVTVAISSVIADGTGRSVTKIRAGTLILDGANTYTGGTHLLGGIVSVSSNANLGAASGGLTFDGGMLATTTSFDTGRSVSLTRSGRFDIADGVELGLTGTISGSGDLIKRGSGTLRLENAGNSYGDTIVRNGMLVGNASSISGMIGNAGTVVFDQASDASFTGAIAGLNGSDGAMIKRGSGELSLAGTSSLDWSVEAGSLVSTAERFGGDVSIGTAGAFSFDQEADATYAGVIAGDGGFAKQGTGELTLTSDSAGFSGHTDVAGGTLIVGLDGKGSLGGTLDVLAGATLGGSGTVGTTMIAAGGAIAPGNSTGLLAVDGDITFADGSIYKVEVDPEGTASDLIHASGSATLNGGSAIHIGEAGTYRPSSTYTILTADSGVTGTFGDVNSTFAFLYPELTYDTNSVYLRLERNDTAFCSVGLSANQCATGTGVESTGPGNPIYDAVIGLDTETAQAAFDQLSGEIHASAKSALIEDSRFMREAIGNRIRSAFGDATAAPMPIMAYGEGGPVAAPSDTDRFAVWTQGFGSWGSFDGDGNAAELDHDTAGVFIGADGLIAEIWRLGLLAGYSHSSFHVDDRSSSGSSDNYHLGLYGGSQWGALNFQVGAAYTWHAIETSRSVSFPGLTDQLTADYDAATAQIFGELGYRIERGSFAFEPFANLAYVNLHTDGFTEDGGAAALSSLSSDTDAAFTTVALRGSTRFTLGTMNATARGMLGWRHAFGDVTPFAINVFAGGDPFTVAGTPIAKDAALIEAGIDLDIANNATFGLSYSGQISDDAQDHGFKAELGVRF